MLLKDKVAVVTGSSRGIGAATVKLLAAQGAKVAVNYVKAQDKGEAVVGQIKEGGGQAILVQADVSRPEDAERLVEEARKAHGPIDILVNNANFSFPVAPFTEYPWEGFESKLVSELRASFFTCRAASKEMIERKQGCIVNVSSGLSRHPSPGFIAHSTAKAGLDAFSRGLAAELGPFGIRVNVVSPGLVLTDATAFHPEEAKQAMAAQTPLRRVGQPDDIAGAILFYCTEWSKFVSGTYLPVCGGMQMI